MLTVILGMQQPCWFARCLFVEDIIYKYLIYTTHFLSLCVLVIATKERIFIGMQEAEHNGVHHLVLVMSYIFSVNMLI
jgi:hypothetical protein